MSTNDLLKIIAIVLMGISCNEETIDYAILSGKIINGKKPLKLFAAFGTDNEDKTIHLAEDGSFKDTIYTQEGQYNIFDGENMIGFYLKPSKEYVLNYDVHSFIENGVELGGNDTAYNKYFTKKSQNRVFINPVERTSESEIRTFLNDIKQKQLNWLAASELPEELKAYERTEFHYEYLVFLRLCLKSVDIESPTEASINELNIDYNNEEHYKDYGPYERLVDDHYRGLLSDDAKQKQLSDTSYSEHQNAIKFYASTIPNEFIKNEVIAQFSLFHLKNAVNTKAFYSDFNTYYTGNDTIFKDKMLDLYLRLSKLEKRAHSPKFYNYKNYAGGTNSLDDFKGSFIYVNLWATWCGNCFGQMPALQQLTKNYEDKNITFLNIAWKDEEVDWRKVVTEKELPGVQLLANTKDPSFFEEYGVYGIPRYILIDPQGNIVDYNAPSPSDGRLDRLLGSILE